MHFETIDYGVVDHVATITLNRPHRHNSFNAKMIEEFQTLWQHIRRDDNVHVVVLRAAGDHAFCSGVDVTEGFNPHPNFWSQDDPGSGLSPRANKVWKPVIAAVHGMVAGGASTGSTTAISSSQPTTRPSSTRTSPTA